MSGLNSNRLVLTRSSYIRSYGAMEMLVIATSVGAAPRAGDDYLGKSQVGDEGGGGVRGELGEGCVDHDSKSRWRYLVVILSQFTSSRKMISERTFP